MTTITLTLEVTDPQVLRRAARVAARDRGVNSRDWDLVRMDNPIMKDLSLLLDIPGVEVETFEYGD